VSALINVASRYFAVDLSVLVSKCIGETEKNLD
jgi:hypothetical protein